MTGPFDEFIGRVVLDSLDGDVAAFERAGGQVIPAPYTAQDEQQAIASMVADGERVLGEMCDGCGYFSCECPPERLDIAEPGVDPEPSTYSGDQGDHDVRAVQLRPENFSQPMIDKAGRLAAAGMFDELDLGQWSILGDSDTWYLVRVFGERTWLATCTCKAQASRWNRAGACAHRALGAWLHAQATGEAIPRWPFLTLPAPIQEDPS